MQPKPLSLAHWEDNHGVSARQMAAASATAPPARFDPARQLLGQERRVVDRERDDPELSHEAGLRVEPQPRWHVTAATPAVPRANRAYPLPVRRRQG